MKNKYFFYPQYLRDKQELEHNRRMTLFVLAYTISALICLLLALNYARGENKPETVQSSQNGVSRTTTQVKGIVYGYNSEVAQTDSDPFTTASGQEVRDGIIANNCLEFGSEVAVPQGELSDGTKIYRVFEVQDRMNSRYNCDTYDIWFAEKSEALSWGKRELTIQVL